MDNSWGTFWFIHKLSYGVITVSDISQNLGFPTINVHYIHSSEMTAVERSKLPQKYAPYECKLVLFIPISSFARKFPSEETFYSLRLLSKGANTFPYPSPAQLQRLEEKKSSTAQCKTRRSRAHTVPCCVTLLDHWAPSHMQQLYTHHLITRNLINRTWWNVSLSFLF